MNGMPTATSAFCISRSGRPAQPIFEGLLRRGVIVRPIAGYGLPRHLRVSIGTEAENRRFLAALDQTLEAA